MRSGARVESRSSLRAPPRYLAAALLVFACGCEPDQAGCESDGDCELAQLCVDGRCEPAPDGVDAGPIDAGVTLADAGSIDAGSRDAGPECQSIEARAQIVRTPADIMIVVDSSGSMGASRDRIRAVIDSDFAAILDARRIDYRVALFADVDVLELSGPLASATPQRLFHINLPTGSGSGANFGLLLANYGLVRTGRPPTYEQAWSTVLRPNAAKIFIHFTDATSSDGSVIDAYQDRFEDALRTLDPVAFPSITYHSFTGIAPNTPAAAPYEPTDPIVTNACTAAEFIPQPGAGYQALAVRTGGLRFPVCQFEDYDSVFQRLADSVIEETAIECTFELPSPPDGERLNLDTVAVTFSAGGPREVFRQTDLASCDDRTFVIDEAAGTLSLCPAACGRVQAAPAESVQLDIAFGCDPDVI